MDNILLLHGPNLNLLHLRPAGTYGGHSLGDIEALCTAEGKKHGMRVDCRQSNHEGHLLDWIHEAVERDLAGVILNAGAYTHTSLALSDALEILSCPLMEVHLSDPKKREPIRRHSFVEPHAARVFAGAGLDGYRRAIEALAERLSLLNA